MSQIVAKVSDIKNHKSLNIVKFETNGQYLYMISLELDKDIEVDTEVILSVNPSHVAISKDPSTKLSYQNQIKSKIIDIDNGELLSSIKLSFDKNSIESIITTSSSKRLDLKIGDEVTALIKASELSILKVLL